MNAVKFSVKNSEDISFIAVLASILAIFCSTTMWRTLSGWPVPSSVIRIAFILCCLALLPLRMKFRRNEFYTVILIALYLLFYIIATRNDISGYMLTVFASFTALITLAVVSVKNQKLGVILNSFEEVIFWLALISLFFWLFGSVLNILPGRTAVVSTFSQRTFRAYTYGYIYFENPKQYQDMLGMVIPRNTAVFVEAPSYASFLIYSLLIAMNREKKNRLHIAVYILASLTTISAKSFLFLIETAALYYWQKQKQKRARTNRQLVTHLAGYTLIAAAAAVFLYFVLDMKADTSVFSYRIDSAMAGVKTFIRHPLFGSGYGNADEILSNVSLSRRATNVSMGLTALLGQGGIYLTGFYLLPFIRCRRILKNTKWYPLYGMLTILALTDLVISRTMYSVVFEMIIAVGYALLIVDREYYS